MIQGLILLLVFTPLAFGTVEPWSIAIMELGAFGLFTLHVGTRGLPLPDRPAARAAACLFLLLTGLVLLQLLPLPQHVLHGVSPAAAAIWRQFGGGAPGASHPLSLWPDATRQELLKLLAYAAVFVVAARHFRSRAPLLLLVKTILFVAGLLAVLAIAQKLTWNGRLLWFYPVEEPLRSGLRIWGPYVNHNHFAGYLEMALPLGLGLLLYLAPEHRGPQQGGWRARLGRLAASRHLASIAGLSLLVLLLAACLLATLSRGAVAASACALLLFLWLTRRRRSLRGKTLRLSLVAAAFCAAVLLPSWGRIAQRFEDIEEKSHVSRLYVLGDSLGIVRDFPLFGTGLGTFERAYPRYQSRYPRLIFDHAHNDYLELATDTGAVGALLAAALAAIFAVSLIRGWRGRHNRFSTCIGAGGICSCLALAVHGGTDFNFHIPANALLFAVIAGLTHAAIFSPNGSGSDEAEPSGDAAPRRRPPQAARLSALAAVPLAGLLLFLPARALLADHHYRQVARLLDDGATAELDVAPIAADTLPRYRNAIAALRRAAALEPSRPAYPQALSDLYALLGEWATTMESLNEPVPAGAPAGKEALALAVSEAERAISRDPANPGLHLALARRYAAADGDLERADAQLRLALAAHPASAPLRYEAALLYLLDGRKDRALEEAGVLARLDDSYLIVASGRKSSQVERRARPYLARLKASYLFKALEISWRSSGDIRLVKALAPPDDDAQAVLALFLEWQGLEE